MIRRVTPAQFSNVIRQLEQRQRQAIDAYSRDVRAHNQKMDRAISEYNRHQQDRVRKINQTIDARNREVRAHNARVRTNRQRLKEELARLAGYALAPRYVTFRVSVNAVQASYEKLEHIANSGVLDGRYNEVLDLSEREAANNAGLMNALLGSSETAADEAPDSLDSTLTPILAAISPDLEDRWKGAIFALSPRNPDAARHFCTSSREIITLTLDTKAPDAAVEAVLPDCPRTQRGTPTRRAKIRYFLHRQGLSQSELEGFVDADIANVIGLFDVFNTGTHGSAGAFDLGQLRAIRKRVEEAVHFLSMIVH